MASATTVLILIPIALPVITILLSLIYLIPILFLRRFHNVNNVFTLNFCFAAICCDIYWLSYSVMIHFFPTSYPYNDAASCFLLNYFQVMCTIQVPYAVVSVSIHRLCSVVYYTKPFFKTKQWAIICISSQWIVGIIFSLLQISSVNLVRISDKNQFVLAI
jgi:hypothetical protein